MKTPEMPRLDIARIPADVRTQFAKAVCELILDMLADSELQKELLPTMPAGWLESARAKFDMETEAANGK